MFLATPVFAEFTAAYYPPQTQEVAYIAGQMRQGQALEKLASLLNRYIELPTSVPIIARSCGQVNAYYSPSSRQVSICYELLADHAEKLSKKYINTLPRERIAQILSSDLTFVLLHEVGHSLIDLYQLPVLGQEEDAADKFAAFLLLNTNGDRVLQDAPLFMPLMKRAGFDKYLLDKMLNSAAIYGDEHALSEQRMANLVCQGFGKNPQAFTDAARAIRLPQSRAQRCANEFAKLNRDVRGLLGTKLALGQQGGVAAQTSESGSQGMVQNEVRLLLDQNRCNGCHSVDARRVGPSYREIANKYRGNDVAQQLINSVKSGSVNVWGPVPAPPQGHVSASDVEVMVRWILSL